MKLLVPLFSFLLLTGCVASSVPENPIAPIQTISGGEITGDTTSLYWYSHRQKRAIQLSEVLIGGDASKYQSDYRWREGKLREMKRQGTQLHDDGLKSFTMHVRYDTEGNAVFQRYTVADTVLPLSDAQLTELKIQANTAIELVKNQNKQGKSLIQGRWAGNRFMRCGDNREFEVAFQPTLSDSMLKQVQAQSQDGFMAVNGKIQKKALIAEQLLLLKDNTQHCIYPPKFLDE
ncbi:DUF1481 domain-containing protein [Photobacterium profundum]|nr:DUF1481 domain-containing protein [Photobacterium profundum]